ncbi:MAG: hypothetical protein Q9N32_04625 [Gammaproteobacteria bacterium]|nr:hypothetical protein [Gammaproteobacteria bacterium]
MKIFLSLLVIFGFYAVVGGCTDKSDAIDEVTLNDTFVCDMPIVIDSDDNQPVPGFLVYISNDF